MRTDARRNVRCDLAAATFLGLATLIFAVALLLTSCGTSGASTTLGPGAPAGPGSTEAPSSGAAAPTGSGGGAASSAQVVMKDFAFSPASVTIRVGGSVTWTNNDSTTHTVVEDNGEFKSGDIAPGKTYSITVDKAGTYTYHCGIHPNMKGTVIVQ